MQEEKGAKMGIWQQIDWPFRSCQSLDEKVVIHRRPCVSLGDRGPELVEWIVVLIGI